MSKLKERNKGFGFKQWFLLILNVVLVLASLSCGIGLYAVSTTLETTTAAERFRGESEIRFAQIGTFFPVGQGKTEEDIFAFRQSLDSKFVEQSLQAPENGSLYVDTYSGSATVTLSTDHGTAAVKAIGVGGDFFHFHPLLLRSGSYIAERDLMDDLVVLDEVLAWRLFGGTELTGMTLYINNIPFVVSGVVAMEDDFASSNAYKEDGCAFLSFPALKKLDENLVIDCYEIVLPDPITGYARSVVEESFPPEQCDVVENSSRYSISHLLDVAGSFGLRSMRAQGIAYPYWENALRLTEDYAVLLLILTAAFAVIPVIFAIVLLIRSICRGCRFIKTAISEKAEATIEQRREERYLKFLEKETGGKS